MVESVSRLSFTGTSCGRRMDIDEQQHVKNTLEACTGMSETILYSFPTRLEPICHAPPDS